MKKISEPIHDFYLGLEVYDELDNREANTLRKFFSNRHYQLLAFPLVRYLKKEDEKYFNQALVCIDMGINPKDLRINEQIAIEYTHDYMEEKKAEEAKVAETAKEETPVVQEETPKVEETAPVEETPAAPAVEEKGE